MWQEELEKQLKMDSTLTHKVTKNKLDRTVKRFCFINANAQLSASVNISYSHFMAFMAVFTAHKA